MQKNNRWMQRRDDRNLTCRGKYYENAWENKLLSDTIDHIVDLEDWGKVRGYHRQEWTHGASMGDIYWPLHTILIRYEQRRF